MSFKKDLFSNIYYSVLLSLVIISRTSYIPALGVEIISIFKNFIMIALLGMWLKTLSHKNEGFIIYTEGFYRNKSIISLGFSLIRSFIELKLAVLIIVFSVSFFMFKGFVISQLADYMIQLLSVSLYTLSILLISTSYLKIPVKNIKFLLILFLPYF